MVGFLDDYDDFMSQWGRGRCVNCGFLAKMAVDTEHVEQFWDVERATLSNRVRGDLFSSKAGALRSWPECYMHAANLAKEADAAIPSDEVLKVGGLSGGVGTYQRYAAAESAIQGVIQRDRHCPRWIRWSMHQSPKWHLDQERANAAERRNSRLQFMVIALAFFTLLATAAGVVQIFRPSEPPTIVVQTPQVNRAPVSPTESPTHESIAPLSQ